MAETEMQTAPEKEVQKVDTAPKSTVISGQNPRMASFKDRGVAFIIDYFILAIASFALTAIFSPMYFYNLGNMMKGGSQAAAASTSFMGGTQMFMGLISLAVFLGYFGYFYTTQGQTLGKKAMKLKVVRAVDLKYVTWGEAILRELFRAFISGVFFFLGYLWYFMSGKRQCWHDSVASTYVVKTDEVGTILMDGLPEYRKEPVKTFGCCGAMGLVFVAFTAFVVWAAVLAAQSISEGIQNSKQNMNMQQQYNDGSGTMNDETMPEGTVPFTNEEEMQKYFEENFPGEMDQLNQAEPQDAPQPF
jgi:uncharacterized RDD family membrane protein YckC